MVEVTRGDQVESLHRGSIAVVAPDGHLIASVGDPDGLTFLRSAAKPFQLAPFVASGRYDGYDFPAPREVMAVMAASHAGEDRHVRVVQAALHAGGLSSTVLQCGTHAPFDLQTAQRLARAGEEPGVLRHNCSGKHAGMALHAKAAGWEVETYWRPDHPVQELAIQAVSTVTDVPVADIATATDGCGVVTFAVPLRALALAYARLADPGTLAEPSLGVALERIRDAMVAHPELVSGDRRQFDTDLMRAVPGRLVAKGGAEGVRTAGLLPGLRGSGGVGVAVKIEDGDGARRAGAAATVEALRQLGILDAQQHEALAAYARPLIRDLPRGGVSGELRPAFRLRMASPQAS